MTPLVISYGSADSGRPVGEIQSKRFVYSNFDKGDDVDKGGLVLIELEEDIVFSKNASQVKLPLKNSKLMADSGKLSGWKIHVSFFCDGGGVSGVSKWKKIILFV